MLACGRTTFYKTIRSGGFPEAIQIVDGADYCWYLDEIEAWPESRRRRPGAVPTPDACPADEEEPVLRPGRGRRRADRSAVDTDVAVFRPRTTRRGPA